MNKKSLALLFFVIVGFTIRAQDVTVYKSPHSLDNTISKLYFSIDKNGYSYLNTQEYKANPRGTEDGFRGRIQVISFETDEVSRLVSCEPTALLEVPFKILVWEEGDDTYIAYINAMNLKHRYMIHHCDEVIHEINKALIRIVNDAIRTH